MPKFFDYHAKMPPMPPEMMQQMAADIKAAKVDQFGVKGLNFFAGTGGQGICLSEAPNADAVCKSHEAHGVPLGIDEVVEVQSLV